MCESPTAAESTAHGSMKWLIPPGEVTGHASFDALDYWDLRHGRLHYENVYSVTDDSALARWIDEVFAEFPAEAARYVGGEKRLQGVLIGAVMKKSKGRADPRKLNQLLTTRLTS